MPPEKGPCMYHIAGKFGGNYIWQTDYFGVLAILNLVIHTIFLIMSMPRLIDWCGLELS